MTQSYNTVNQASTHDLFIEARQFSISLARATPTTLTITITRPASLEVADGAAVLLATAPIKIDNAPVDGSPLTPNTTLPSTASEIADLSPHPQVVGFWSKILANPLPGTASGDTITWTISVTNADANTLYYAAVYPTSNILQYYPLGVHSYPLEASRIEKDSSSYTGSIPQLSHAPDSPADGFIYYDIGMNLVQYYSGTHGSWIPTRADSIITGASTPAATIGQTYLLSGSNQFFSWTGNNYTQLSPANTLVKIGGVWTNCSSLSALIDRPTTPVLAQIIYSYTSQRVEFWDGTGWIPGTPGTMMLSSGSPIPLLTGTFTIEATELRGPQLGQLFYNTTTKDLSVWTGSAWTRANTDQQGTPTTDKRSIGTDGSYDERVRMIGVLKAQLGWPQQCVELTEEQFNIAIDNAVDTYRQLCDGAYKPGYILLMLMTDQQKYYLNSPVDNTDHIVSVDKISRLNLLGANTQSWDSNIYFQMFLNQYYSAGYVDTLSIHMVNSLSEQFALIFAQDMPFVWDEPTRELQVLRKVSRNEKVILQVQLERTEQELLMDRWAKQWLQAWSLSEAMYTLGMIRTKFASGTPGAAGTITLNGDLLISEANTNFDKLREQLFNFEAGGHVHGPTAFIFG